MDVEVVITNDRGEYGAQLDSILALLVAKSIVALAATVMNMSRRKHPQHSRRKG
jgi:hypothetical protein